MTYPNYADLSISHGALLDSWQLSQPYIEPISTDMSGGNTRRRTRPGDGIARVQFDVMFTQAEFATFQTFMFTTLNRGTSKFNMLVWNGSTVVEKLVQFAADPKTSTAWPKYVVTFDLLVYGGL